MSTPSDARSHLARVVCAIDVHPRFEWLAMDRRAVGPLEDHPDRLRLFDVASVPGEGARDQGLASASTRLVSERWQIRAVYPVGGPVAREDLDRTMRDDGLAIVRALRPVTAWQASGLDNLMVGVDPLVIDTVTDGADDAAAYVLSVDFGVEWYDP